MRWRFPHPSENAARDGVLGRIDAWWRAFEAAAPRLDAFFRRREAWDLVPWMREHLGAVDHRIMWEFGPATRATDGHRLVLTPEADHHLRPLVEVVLSRAPEVAGWEFHGHRLAEPLSVALRTVGERTSVDLATWTARADISDEGLVDVTFAPPSPMPTTPAAQSAALLFVEALVGEEAMNVWIGEVTVEERASEGGSLTELSEHLTFLFEARRALIPHQPFWQRTADASWTLLRLAPKTNATAALEKQDKDGASDYPGQTDMLVAKTLDFALWRAQHGRRPFHSRRFSRSGETMATLKIDGSEGLPADGLADKAAIEDAITAALEPRGLGCQIGGGTGLRYSYVDLALTDVAAAMEALRPVLRQGKLPKRTWLQFFDAELAGEWLPLWEDTPPPPR
jgi:hypothetical protein